MLGSTKVSSHNPSLHELMLRYMDSNLSADVKYEANSSVDMQSQKLQRWHEVLAGQEGWGVWIHQNENQKETGKNAAFFCGNLRERD